MTVLLRAPLEIGISVIDLERMSAFYEEVLGFERISEATLAADRARLAGFGAVAFRMVRLQTNYGERIKLLQATPAAVPREGFQEPSQSMLAQAGICYLTFIVDDLDETIQRLSDAGVQLMSDGPVQTRPGTRLVFFRDCEGNVLELVQYGDLAAYRPDLPLRGRGPPA